ncbi:MAG: hypothetical protein IT318_23650 [Anaerolineales bacterium]|nr:hypothetical protein [Anaerolineales bacterium]
MATARQSQVRAYQEYAWVILFLLSALLVVTTLIVAGVEDHAHEFQADTGATWVEFTAAYPGVADAYVLTQRLLYVGFISLALFALIITYFGVRQGHRWAWWAMWLLPAALVLTTLLFLQSRRPETGAVYGGFAAVAVIGLLLPIRKFVPGQSRPG